MREIKNLTFVVIGGILFAQGMSTLMQLVGGEATITLLSFFVFCMFVGLILNNKALLDTLTTNKE